MLQTYRFLTHLSKPALSFLLYMRLRRGKEMPARLQEKKGQPTRARPQGPLVWFHGASVGETLALMRLTDIIHRKHPDMNMMVTSGTKSSASILVEKLPSTAFHQFLPLDHPVWVERFLDYWRPNLAIMTESDFWPNLLCETKKKNIPLLLVNGRISPKSFKNWKKLRGFSARIFSFFDAMLLQRPIDEKFFTELGADPSKITVTGNIKYSALPLSFDSDEHEQLKQAIGERPFWVYASCHPGEDRIAYQAHRALQSKFPDLLTIIIPRHPDKKELFVQTLKTENLSYVCRSEDADLTPDTNIYIADTFGEMGLFFSLTSIAFIGGSFVDLGCHNPIEAAQLETAILFGPSIYNFTETCYDLIGHEAAIQCEDADDLVHHLGDLLKNDKKRHEMQANALAFSKEKSNIVHMVYDHIKPYLEAIPTHENT